MDNISLTLTQIAEKFYSLFKGLNRAHGIYQIENNKNDIENNLNGNGNKKKGKAKTVKKEWGVNEWKLHLTGKQGLGIIPIMDDSNVYWGAIDIDRYDIDLIDFCKKIENTKLVPCRTKSGGLHLFCFTNEPVKAATMKKSLEQVAKKLGFGGSEIFPKQTKVISDRGDVGNWINMPYFDAKNTTRFAILKGKKIGPKEFIIHAEQNKYKESELKNIHEKVTITFVKEIFVNGPPCLNYLGELGFPKGSRNNALFNIGVFYRKSNPDEWKQKIREANEKYVKPPLPNSEVDILIRSLERKTYRYMCNETPINDHCDKPNCVQEKFGVHGDDDSKFPSLDSLTKIDSEPPVYFLTVEGNRIGPIESEDLLAQHKFCKLSFEHLAIFPPKLKEGDWRKLLQVLLDTQTIIEVDDEDKPKYALINMLNEFCNSRAQTEIEEEIVLGRVYFNNEDKKYYFRLIDFLNYLEKKKWYHYDKSSIIAILSEFGLEKKRLRIKCKNYQILKPHVWVYKGMENIYIKTIEVEEAPY